MVLNIAHQVQSLVKLEAKYGPLPEFPPAIDDVLDYFESVCGHHYIGHMLSNMSL